MPVIPPERVEYNIIIGHASLRGDDGAYLPAYWAHPDAAGRFPALIILHDWQGITDAERRMAQRFAQLGYYAVVPDLFDAAFADAPETAARLVEARSRRGFRTIDTVFSAIERHPRTNGTLAVVGLGLGGGLAYEAALKRGDLAAAVALYGAPQRYFGKFRDAKAPLLAMYGSADPDSTPDVIDQLRRELGESRLAHEVVILDGVARGFPDAEIPADVWAKLLAFLEKHRAVPRDEHL